MFNQFAYFFIDSYWIQYAMQALLENDTVAIGAAPRDTLSFKSDVGTKQHHFQ